MTTVVKEVVAKFSGDASGLENASKKASSALDGLKTVAKFGAAAVVGVGAAFGVLTASSMASIDALSKLSSSLDIAIEKYQAMQLVANEAGVSEGQLSVAIRTTQRAIAGNIDAISDLGLEQTELLATSPDEQFNAIAKSLNDVENSTQRTNIAMEIFGRAGGGVINMIENYSLKVAEAEQFNNRFNISLSEIDAKTVEEANDAFGRLGIAASGLGNTMAVALAPVITEISNALLAAGVDGEDFANIVDFSMSTAAMAIDGVRATILGLRIGFNAILSTVIQVVSGIVQAIAEMDEALFETLNKIPGVSFAPTKGIQEFSESVRGLADASVEEVSRLTAELSNFDRTINKIERAQAAAKTRAESGVTPKYKSGGQFLFGENDTAGAINGIKKAAEDAKKPIVDLQDTMKTGFNDATKAITSGADAMQSFKNIALNALASIANSVLSSIGSSASIAIGGIFGDIIGSALGGIKLPGFAAGTNYVPNDMVADVHRGERIIPAADNAKLMRGIQSNGGRVEIVQNISIGAGVQGAVRAEIARMLPDLRKSTISGVEDARLRGAIV